MFTGLIETLGIVRAVRTHPGMRSLTIEAADFSGLLRDGDSVAVNGVCQTVVSRDGALFRVQALGDTLDKTTLGFLVAGVRVNLERALRADGRLDGHMVQGHVSGTGRVRRWEKRGRAAFLHIELPADLARYAIPEGSVAIDGVSLTVAGMAEPRPSGRGGARETAVIRISVIPHTRSVTNLGLLKPGDAVNVETDVMARYAERFNAPGGAGAKAGEARGLRIEDLRDWGYA